MANPRRVRLSGAVDAIRDGIGKVTDTVRPVEGFLEDVDDGAVGRFQETWPDRPEPQIANSPQWQCRDSCKKLRLVDVRPASEGFKMHVLKGVKTIFRRL